MSIWMYRDGIKLEGPTFHRSDYLSESCSDHGELYNLFQTKKNAMSENLRIVNSL